MCTVMAALGVAMSAAGQAASFAAKKKQVDAANAQSMANAQNASIAAGWKYAAEGRELSQKAEETRQKGYTQTMKGRQAKGQVLASAGSSGIDASSLTVGDLFSFENQKTGETLANLRSRRDHAQSSYLMKTQMYHQEAVGRAQSMPMQADPSPLGMIVGIANSGLGAYKAYAGTNA